MQLQKYILANQGKVRLQLSGTSTVHLAAVHTGVIQVKAKRYHHGYHYRLGPGDTVGNCFSFQSYDTLHNIYIYIYAFALRIHCLHQTA